VVVLRPYPADGTAVPAAAKLLIANNIVAAEIDVFKIFIAHISFFVMPYDNKREKSGCQSRAIGPSTGASKMLMRYTHLRAENLVKRLG
jgi:hypothetical protein